jgi:hypothetical protein
MNRRCFLFAGAATTAALALPLGGCTTTTSADGTKTFTLNVAEVAADATVVKNVVTALMSNPLISAAVGVYGLPVQLAIGVLDTGLVAWSAACGGSESVSYNGSGIAAAFENILTDAEDVLAKTKTAISAASAAVSTGTVSATLTAAIGDAQTGLDAAETAVSFLQALVALVPAGTASARYGSFVAVKKMTRAKTFAYAHVKDPMVH